jgi:hypothetical protein
MGTIFTAPPITNEIPRAIFLGILSITKPTSNANPDADFLPTASSPWDLFLFLTLLMFLLLLILILPQVPLLTWIWISIKNMICYTKDTPPRVNPIITGGIECNKLNAGGKC